MPDILTSVRKFLRARPRSVYEVREYLKRKEFQTSDIEGLLRRLTEEGRVNDRKFAKLWIDDRLSRHPRSKYLIIKELTDKGLEENLIEDVFSREFPGYDEVEEVRRLGRMRLNKAKRDDPEKAGRTVYAYLRRLGFSEELVMTFMEDEVR